MSEIQNRPFQLSFNASRMSASKALALCPMKGLHPK
jgi:hypothetical protein